MNKYWGWVFLYMKGISFECVYTHVAYVYMFGYPMNVQACVIMEARWRRHQESFSDTLHSIFWNNLSLNLEFTNLVRLTGKWTIGLLLPQGYRNELPFLYFTWVLKIYTLILMLHNKHFTCWSISTTFIRDTNNE